MASTFLTAQWRNLLMLNYEIDPEILRPLVPVGTELDFWNGKTFVSMVGFQFLQTRIKRMWIPFHSNFNEINLRFYLRRQGPDGPQRGVAFIKEIVPRWAIAIATVARCVYNENYVSRPMTSSLELPAHRDKTGRVRYGWKSPSGWNYLQADFSGEPKVPEPGSEEEFITEHYWGFSSQRDGSTLEYRVTHPQWRVWQASPSTFTCHIEEVYGPQFQETLQKEPTSAFVAEGSAIEVYSGVPLEESFTGGLKT